MSAMATASVAADAAAVAAVAAAAASVSPPLPAMGLNASSPPAGVHGDSDPQRCRWRNCSAMLPTAELLYDHVCEQHIGRKSTGKCETNCHWDTCSVETCKRDHITSHIRVHIPLKPHACHYCSKRFKRPQDLKKHVKTHAPSDDDDRSNRARHSGSGGAGAGGYPGLSSNNGYNSNVNYSNGMNYGYGNGHHSASYTNNQSGSYYTAPPGMSQNKSAYYEPNVYGSQQSLDRKIYEQQLMAMHDAVKSGAFNPTNYADWYPWLSALQLPPPQVSQQQAPPAPAPAPAHSHYSPPRDHSQSGVYGHASHPSTSTASSMQSVRSRQTLDQMLHQLDVMNAAAEHELAQQMMATHSEHSVHGDDSDSAPSLTPGSSAMSYTSGHSPSTGHPPLASLGSSASSVCSAAMYPSLSSIAGPPSLGAPVSTLGPQYDPLTHRRLSASLLRSGKPTSSRRKGSSPETPSTLHQATSAADADENEDTRMSTDGDKTSSPRRTPPPTTARDLAVDTSMDTKDDNRSRREGSPTPVPPSAAVSRINAAKALIHRLRAYIQTRLDSEDYDESDRSAKSDASSTATAEDTARHGSRPPRAEESESPRASSRDEDHDEEMADAGPAEASSSAGKKADEPLYPTLPSA